MSVSQNEINEFVKEHLKLVGIKGELSAGVIKTASHLGGAMFWRNPWYFAERHKDVTPTAGTSEYSCDDELETGVDGIAGIKRLSSSDYGYDLVEETPDSFDKRYPYPTSESNSKSTVYKLYYKNGKLYFALFPPPDTADTLEVTYRLGWALNRLAIIPDNFVDVYMEAVLCFALPMRFRTFQRQMYQSALSDALSVNSPSRKVVSERRTPGHASPMSEMEIALEIGGEYDDW